MPVGDTRLALPASGELPLGKQGIVRFAPLLERVKVASKTKRTMDRGELARREMHDCAPFPAAATHLECFRVLGLSQGLQRLGAKIALGTDSERDAGSGRVVGQFADCDAVIAGGVCGIKGSCLRPLTGVAAGLV